MIARKLRTALTAAGIVAPKCVAFGGIGPADFGMEAYKLTLSEARANVAYFSKAMRKIDSENIAALAEGFRNLDAAEMEVEMLESAYNLHMMYAETY